MFKCFKKKKIHPINSNKNSNNEKIIKELKFQLKELKDLINIQKIKKNKLIAECNQYKRYYNYKYKKNITKRHNSLPNIYELNDYKI